MRALAILISLAAAACFSPKFKDGESCGANGECPPGQSCGADLKCHAGGPGTFDAADTDAPPGSADAMVDALPPDSRTDAMPVGCTGDGDCATPPDKCWNPNGTCDLANHKCVFTAVDCASLNGDCTAGVCDPSVGCTKQNVREGLVCGAATTCGAFDACAGFSSTCDSSGTHTRTCTDFTCMAGTCGGTDRADTQGCTVSTDGNTCGSSTVTGCGPCTGGSNNGCSPDGNQTCTCTAFKCVSDSCQPMGSTCAQTGCEEFGVGDECLFTHSGCPVNEFRGLCCSATHACSVVCEPCAQ
jgi:hypothetical protein